jgi:hypothetical protein
LHITAEEVAVTEAAVAMEKTMIPAHMIRSTGRTSNATSATEEGIHDSSMASAASSIKKLKKDIKSIKKASTMVNTQLAQLKEADSDISESEGEEALYFQVDQALQFAQVDKKFEPRMARIFKQAGSSIKIDLNQVILLDSQSTMDLFCNADLVSNISKSRSSMRLKSNVGTMVVTRKSTVEGYNKKLWFST